MPSIQKISTTVEPDYFQFYLRRRGAEWRSDEVSDEGYEARLWAAEGFVYVGCHRKFGTTPVVLDVLNARPTKLDEAWQHVAEVSLPDGDDLLDLLNWEEGDPAVTLHVGPGPLRLRVHWRGLAEGLFEGIDSESRSDERFLIQVWPAEVEHRTILRRWSGWQPGWFDRTPSA